MLLLILGLLGQPPVADTVGLEVRHLGNAAFAITDGTTTLVTDFPYVPGAYGSYRFDSSALEIQGDVIAVISHGHADHFNAEVFASLDWTFIGPRELAGDLPEERVIPINPIVRVNDIEIQVFPTSHGEGYTEQYSYLVTWDGVRFFFSGDSDEPEFVLSLRDLDAAFVPYWLASAIHDQGSSIDAGSVVLQHLSPGEAAPDCTRCVLLRPGEGLTLPAGG